MKKLYFILFYLISAPTFAQWKSYYPETNESKKTLKEQNLEKDNFLFNQYLFNALKAKSLENFEESLNFFQKCIKLDDSQAVPFYESAVINKENGNFDLATEQIKTAVTIENDNRWYVIAYAEILFSNQDFKNAAIEYKKLIALEPGNEEFYFMLSDTYIYANDFEKAIAVYDELEKYKGVDKIISMQKHKLYRKINNMKGAIKELQTILIAFPDEIEAMEILSELYLLNDEKEKAFELFKKIAVLAPENGRIHLTLADYYRQNGENETSYNELKLAFKSTKLNIDTKVRILISYYQLIPLNPEMSLQAIELSEIMISVHPNDLKARSVYADIMYTDNQFQEAKEQYLYILEQDKSKSQIWSQVLFIQAEQNDFEGLLKTSSEALEYFPTDPLFYYFNGVSNKRFKNYDDAINSLEMGVEFVIDNQNLLLEFYSSLADTYHATKAHKLSDAFYEKVLAVDSNNILVLNNYAYYLSVRKVNLERAKAMSFKCNELEQNNGTYQDTYAWILFRMGDYSDAKRWMQKSLKNGGDKNAVVVEHYGDILYKLGEVKLAVEQWKIAKVLGDGSKQLSKKITEGKLYE
jgi:tetratricopeptide (TPR) repeat protein